MGLVVQIFPAKIPVVLLSIYPLFVAIEHIQSSASSPFKNEQHK